MIGLRTELLLLGDQQRRLDLIVHGFVVGPEGASRGQTLRRRHLFPEPRGGRGCRSSPPILSQLVLRETGELHAAHNVFLQWWTRREVRYRN